MGDPVRVDLEEAKRIAELWRTGEVRSDSRGELEHTLARAFLALLSESKTSEREAGLTFQGHAMESQFYSHREVLMIVRALGATDAAIKEALAAHPEKGEAHEFRR